MVFVKKKVALLGDAGVGKTSLINRFVLSAFSDDYIVTVGTKVSKKDVVLKIGGEEHTVSFSIWDVLGQHGYTGVQAQAYAGVDGALMVCDVTRAETLGNLDRYWIPSLVKIAGNVPMVFIGNKADLPAVIGVEQIAGIASRYAPDLRGVDSWATAAFLTSAKTGQNVDVAFRRLARLFLSPNLVEDPTKDVIGPLMAQSVARTQGFDSLTSVVDAIILDFCHGFSDQETAMSIVREKFRAAGFDIWAPDRKALIRAIALLSEAERTVMDLDTVQRNRTRRLKMVEAVR